LKEYLEKRGTEVINMLYYEYDQDVALEVRYEEGLEKGLEKGREERDEYVLSLIAQGLSAEEIKQRLNEGKEDK
jgi:ATP/maltotriose-dependent transcriptional regulator MalT